MEQTDNLHYNNDDKKIYLNAYNNNNKIRKPSVKKPKSKNDYRDKKIERDNYSKNDNIYSSKLYEKRKVNNTPNYNTERAIDFFIIDNDYDIKFLTKTKKKINRKINKDDVEFKQNIMYDICKTLIQLELPKTMVKNFTDSINVKEFGKGSELQVATFRTFIKFIQSANYISKAF